MAISLDSVCKGYQSSSPSPTFLSASGNASDSATSHGSRAGGLAVRLANASARNAASPASEILAHLVAAQRDAIVLLVSKLLQPGSRLQAELGVNGFRNWHSKEAMLPNQHHLSRPAASVLRLPPASTRARS